MINHTPRIDGGQDTAIYHARANVAFQEQEGGFRIANVNGHYERIIDFDFDEVDRRLAGNEFSTDARAEAAEILSRIMTWVWGKGANPHSALVKFTALTAGLRPDLVGDKSYIELAVSCGVTKQMISRAALRAQAAFNLKFARSRPDEARMHMAEKAKGNTSRSSFKPSKARQAP